MTQSIVEFFSSITHNDYLTLFLISIIPIIELRGAIVIMAGMDSINMIAGMFCCVAGSTVVIVPLMLLVRPLLRKLKRSRAFSKLARNMEANLTDRAAGVHTGSDKQQSVQAEMAGDEEGKRKRRPLGSDTKKFLGLFAFVAVPLPMTGAWTGSCVGAFLDFPIWKASLAVFFGNIVAGGILTLIAYFLPQQYADLFLYGFVILAVALAVMLFFSRSKRMEKKRKEELAKYNNNQNEYELALLKKEADENGEVLIKREYVDENGDRHIVIGKDESRNKSIVDDDKVI